jgi:hypothetical protein
MNLDDLKNLQNPDAMVAGALAKLDQTPEVIATLGPVALAVWGAARKELLQLGEKIATQVGQELGEGLAGALGPELEMAIVGLAGEVAGAVAELIPFIGTVVAIVEMGVNLDAQAEAQAQAVYKAEAADALGRRLVGRGGQITPADIFAPDGAGVYSSLGKAIVGITEGQPSQGPGKPWVLPGHDLWDAPLEHTSEALELVFPEVYRSHIRAMVAAQAPMMDEDTGMLHAKHSTDAELPPWAVAEMHIGIPQNIRTILELLRRAMGAQPKDGGAALWPIYLDLLSHEIDVGHLTQAYASFLLGHYWRDPGGAFARFSSSDELGLVTDEPHGSNPMGDGSPGPYAGPHGFDPFVNQFWSILQNWRSMRANPANLTPRMRLVIGKVRPRIAGLRLRLVNPKQQAIDAYAQALGLPPGSY